MGVGSLLGMRGRPLFNLLGGSSRILAARAVSAEPHQLTTVSSMEVRMYKKLLYLRTFVALFALLFYRIFCPPCAGVTGLAGTAAGSEECSQLQIASDSGCGERARVCDGRYWTAATGEEGTKDSTERETLLRLHVSGFGLFFVHHATAPYDKMAASPSSGSSLSVANSSVSVTQPS